MFLGAFLAGRELGRAIWARGSLAGLVRERKVWTGNHPYSEYHKDQGNSSPPPLFVSGLVPCPSTLQMIL